MLPSLGITELVVILVIALIFFGPRKLPELGKSLGKSIGEFRKASNELKSTLEEEIRVEEHREQRAKLAVEQKTAVEGGEAHAPAAPVDTLESVDSIEPADIPEPAAEPAVEEPTVSRTTTSA
jgi:TatA/E family protein of Tat protein translocase